MDFPSITRLLGPPHHIAMARARHVLRGPDAMRVARAMSGVCAAGDPSINSAFTVTAA
jgi:hypothetical protein